MNGDKDLRILLGLLMMLLLTILPLSVVAAANNQGLEWGVEVGQRIDYDVEFTYHSATLDLHAVGQMYVLIDGLPAIPDNVTHLVQVAFYNFTTYWSNGTVMDDVWYDILHFTPFYLLPIGNWSLIRQLSLESAPLNIVQEYGSVLTSSTPPDEHYNSTAIIMKSDGVGAYLPLEWIRTGMEDALYIELLRHGYELPATTTTADGNNTFLLVLGGSVIAAVIVLIPVIARRR